MKAKKWNYKTWELIYLIPGLAIVLVLTALAYPFILVYSFIEVVAESW